MLSLGHSQSSEFHRRNNEKDSISVDSSDSSSE